MLKMYIFQLLKYATIVIIDVLTMFLNESVLL